MQTEVPIVALHLTRPPVEIPDRKKLGMASHLDASKGAYIIKNYESSSEKKGVVIVRGTSSTNSVVQILDQLEKENINVKVVSAISWELFKNQTKEYREKIISDQEWADSMIITNSALRLMHNWILNKVVEIYSMSPDHDNRWRTGGSLDEIIEESKLDKKSILDGIRKFVNERSNRLELIKKYLPASRV
jgi:transketolase